MKFRKIISKGLALGIILNSILFNSFANTSLDTRYEDFQGDNYSVDNLVKGTNSEFEIEGHTMINVFDYSKMRPITSELSNLGFSISGREITRNYTMALDSQNSTYWYSDEDIIKDGEIYTFVADITENTVNDRVEIYPYIWQFAEWSKGDVNINPGYTGKAIISFKSKMNHNITLLYRHFNQAVTGSVTMSNIMLLKGDYYDAFTSGDTKIPEYFEGSKSVGEDEDKVEIVSKNKNLLDINNLKVMSYSNELPTELKGSNITFNVNNDTINYSATNTWNIGVGGIYKVKKNTLYTAKYEEATCDKNYNMSINILGLYKNELDIAYWSDKNYLNYTPRVLNIQKKSGEKNASLTYNSQDYDYLAIYIGGAWKSNASGTINITLKNVGIYETGSSTVEYERYSTNKEEILLPEPLRGLPGVKDKVVKKNGQWYIKRNVGRAVIDGSENWVLGVSDNGIRFFEERSGLNNKHYHKPASKSLLSDKLLNNKIHLGMFNSEYKDYSITIDLKGSNEWRVATTQDMTLDKFKEWLSVNKPEVYYELETPMYEPINKNLSLYLYPEMSYVSSDSSIPVNIKMTVDRILNRVVEAVELAKTNPTTENLSKARMWINLLDESTEKDYFQNELDIVTNIDDLQMELKTASANLDVYIKCENMLSMSLDSNQISFEDFSGIEDVEKTNAVNVTINSSLPYQLNAYLPAEIQNADKTKTMNKEILQLKESNESDYKEFANITDKVVLKDNCNSGNQLVHGIDIMLKGGVAHEKDVYKATIKLEVEQK